MNNSDQGTEKSFFGKVIIFFTEWILSKSRKRKEQLRRDPLVKTLQVQIFNLFAPKEKLTAPQVVERLKERTGGRKEISLFLVYDFLDWLVEEEKLSHEVTSLEKEGVVYTKTVYFLL